jgi:hypothetical protein
MRQQRGKPTHRLLGMGSIYVQFTRGRGTPAPVTPARPPVDPAAGAGVATRKLLSGPPYSHCRNSVALDTIVAYLGLSVTGRVG